MFLICDWIRILGSISADLAALAAAGSLASTSTGHVECPIQRNEGRILSPLLADYIGELAASTDTGAKTITSADSRSPFVVMMMMDDDDDDDDD